MDQRTQITGRRASLLALAESAHRLAAAERLLADLCSWLKAFLSTKYPGVKLDAGSFAGYLFAYRGEDHALPCVASNCETDDPLCTMVAAWGKDIVGTAFRRREPAVFARRSYRHETALLANLPERVQCLFAFPVSWNPEQPDDWPVGVIAIGSHDPESGLMVLEEDETSGIKLAATIAERWQERGGEILP